jgi:GMP synthase-like glutamine amidotransferase
MVLVINCIPSPKDRDWFSRVVVPRLEGIAERPVHVVNLDQLEDFLPNPQCSHVVISGSELSAARRYPTDDALIALIRRSVNQHRVVLGICYGHQMVARALVGDGACRRAAIPEFGFKRVSLVPNPLFAGIDTLTPVHSHSDEVTGLPEDRFEVIASTDHCEVQAWQLRGRTVWGVQFHPELDERSGRQMLARNLETEEGAKEVFVDELEDPAHVEAGRRLFENFFRTPPAAVHRALQPETGE